MIKYTRNKSLYLGWFIEYTLGIWSSWSIRPKDSNFWLHVVGDKIAALYGIALWIYVLKQAEPLPAGWKIWLGLAITLVGGALFHWAIDRWGKPGDRNSPQVSWTMAFMWGQVIGLATATILVR